MNKLITTNTGGYPFVLDDLRFIDDGVREVLKSKFERFIDQGDPTDKGFLVTNSIDLVVDSTTKPAPGFDGQAMEIMFAYIKGEIYLLPAGNLPSGISPSAPCFVEPDISFTGSTPGQKVFENGSNVETYQIRRAKYTLTPTQTDYIQITSTAVLNSANVTAGADFEFIKNCHLRQREFEALTINETNNSLNNLSFLVNILNANYNDTAIVVNDLLNDWINVPMSTLMRTTDPVFWFSKFSALGGSGNVITPVHSVGSINQTTSFLKLKKIGKTVFVSLKIDALIFPAYSLYEIGGLYIDLNNLNISTLTIGTLSKFAGTLRAGEKNLDSPAGNIIEVVEANNFPSINKNGIFMRLLNGTSYAGAFFNINYYLPVSGGSAKTKPVGDSANNTVVAEWYISGTLIFEID